jgi:hypothetical protein
MATLFFDGFDRATVLKKLDQHYWSTEYPTYPKYAFGGYTYDNNTISNNNSTYYLTYTNYAVNNGTIPSGLLYRSHDPGMSYQYEMSNRYPGFGQPPGFLAITNVPINNIYNLEPISYIQLSGFLPNTGTKSYFGMRCLGIENKHDNYLNEAYPLGRFGNKHPLVAFCSGNTTGLLLSIVKITGNHLLPLRVNDPSNNDEGPRISLGLQVEQNGGISGVFDLNISDAVANYRVTPLYIDPADGYSARGLIPTNNNFKILTIATDGKNGNPSERAAASYTSVISRWVHFEFEIDNISKTIQLKLESTDALVENTNTLINRGDWDIKIPISSFNFNNIRLFNRTYYKDLVLPEETSSVREKAYYYGLGKLLLYDDITLVNNVGNKPTYFLGHDSKVLPINPGFNLSLANSGNVPDGLTQWSTNGSTYRRNLASLDQDTSVIYTDRSQAINAIAYSEYSNVGIILGDNYTNVIDEGSRWRLRPNDAIGGLKVYNSARKNFLDSSFINVYQNGITDPYRDTTILLIHAEENPVKDYSKYDNIIVHNNNAFLTNVSQFGNSGLAFTDNDSYLVIENNKHPGSDIFTLECWVQFTGQNDRIVLLDTKHRPLSYVDSSDIKTRLAWYRISCTPDYLQIERSTLRDPNISSDYGQPVFSNDYSRKIPASLILPFPTTASTGNWHHIALSKNLLFGTNSGWYTVFLDGQSGNTFKRINLPTSLDYSFLPGSIGEFTPTYGGSYSDENYTTGILYCGVSGVYQIPVDASGRYAPYRNLDANYLSKSNTYPQYNYMYIGYSGLIDDFRYSLGVARYTENFAVPNAPFKAHPEDYLEFGPVHNVDRSIYKTFQFYQMDNPATNMPWISGDIFTSGLLLGVKKL